MSDDYYVSNPNYPDVPTKCLNPICQNSNFKPNILNKCPIDCINLLEITESDIGNLTPNEKSQCLTINQIKYIPKKIPDNKSNKMYFIIFGIIIVILIILLIVGISYSYGSEDI